MSGCQPDEKAFEFIGCTNKECLSNCCNQLRKRIKKLENFMPDVLHDFEKRIAEIEKRMNAQGDVNSENYFFIYDYKKRLEEIERQLYNKSVP